MDSDIFYERVREFDERRQATKEQGEKMLVFMFALKDQIDGLGDNGAKELLIALSSFLNLSLEEQRRRSKKAKDVLEWQKRIGGSTDGRAS